MPAAATAVPPDQGGSFDLARVRSRLLDQFMLLIGLGLCVTQGLAIYKAVHIGVHWALPFTLGGSGGVWLLYLLRHQLSYRRRAWLFLACTWVIVLASVTNLGPVANSKGFFVLLTLGAMIFLGPRAGWLNVAGVALALGGIGTAAVQGWVSYHLDYDAYVRLPVVWLQSTFSYTVYSAASALIATRLLTSASAAAQRFARQARALREVEMQLRTALLSAETANRTKDRFLAMVSHELRTPLHALLGFAEVLDDSGVCSGRQADLLAGIRRNGRSLLDLVNEILDLARGETGQLQVEARPCALRPVLERALAQVQRQAQAKALELRLVSVAGVPDTVLIDPDRLLQVLTNLLHNAVKFTARGHVTLSLEAAAVAGEPPRCALRFTVVDTGSGIAAQDQARIFEPFEQAGAMTQRRRGSGLGLSICRHFVAAMGGQIELKSQCGVGSRFEIRFAQVPILIDQPADGASGDALPADRATDLSGSAPSGAAGADPLGLSLALALALLLRGEPAARWRALGPAADPAASAAFAALAADLAQAQRSLPLADWAVRLARAEPGEDRRRLWAAFADFLWEPPPRAALAELRALADLGLTSRIEDWCAAWAAADQRYAAFVRRVLALAYTFDPGPLCALVDAFLDEAPPDPPAAGAPARDCPSG